MTGPRPLTREDVLLLIAAGATGRYALDPIRLMKAAFIVSQRGRNEWRTLFHFEPFDYGPFDKTVYVSRDNLLSQALLVSSAEGRYASYSLSESGKIRVGELRAKIGDEDAEWFAGIGTFVTSKSFSELLQAIYSAFPEFATRSVAHV